MRVIKRVQNNFRWNFFSVKGWPSWAPSRTTY